MFIYSNGTTQPVSDIHIWKTYATYIFVKMPLYVSKSISELQIQAATYVFELSAGNCHR